MSFISAFELQIWTFEFYLICVSQNITPNIICSQFQIEKFFSLATTTIHLPVFSQYNTMLTPFEVFAVNEKVHVLCSLTRIWEEARVTSFESSWKVQIEFENWSGKHKKRLVEVRQNQPRENWEISKPIEKVSITLFLTV